LDSALACGVGGRGRARVQDVDRVLPSLVSLSFTLSVWLFDLDPYWYGLTNLLLMFGCMVAVERLARRAGVAPGLALLAAAVWALNFHGVNMAILWISGRTSLLLTLFALLAALAFERRRPVTAAAWTLMALFSKEEAVMLPFILVAWRIVDTRVESRPFRRPGVFRDTWPLFVALAVYLALRSQSGAFTPVTAPGFYQFTLELGHVATNALEYLYRSATASALVLVLTMIVARQLPRLDATQRAVALKGLAWWLGGFAITVWLPVRSSLYAVFPSVGVVLILSALTASLVQSLTPRRTRLAVAVGLLLPFLLLPVYWSRNHRWVELADLSAATLSYVRERVGRLPDGAVIALADDGTDRASFENAFGALLPEASRLFLDRDMTLQLDPAPDLARPRLEVRRSEIGP
jgi:hypothetical protein